MVLGERLGTNSISRKGQYGTVGQYRECKAILIAILIKLLIILLIANLIKLLPFLLDVIEDHQEQPHLLLHPSSQPPHQPSTTPPTWSYCLEPLVDGKDQVVPIEGEHDGYFSNSRDLQGKGLADSLVSLSLSLLSPLLNNYSVEEILNLMLCLNH